MCPYLGDGIDYLLVVVAAANHLLLLKCPQLTHDLPLDPFQGETEGGRERKGLIHAQANS